MSSKRYTIMYCFLAFFLFFICKAASADAFYTDRCTEGVEVVSTTLGKASDNTWIIRPGDTLVLRCRGIQNVMNCGNIVDKSHAGGRLPRFFHLYLSTESASSRRAVPLSQYQRFKYLRHERKGNDTCEFSFKLENHSHTPQIPLSGATLAVTYCPRNRESGNTYWRWNTLKMHCSVTPSTTQLLAGVSFNYQPRYFTYFVSSHFRFGADASPKNKVIVSQPKEYQLGTVTRQSFWQRHFRILGVRLETSRFPGKAKLSVPCWTGISYRQGIEVSVPASRSGQIDLYHRVVGLEGHDKPNGIDKFKKYVYNPSSHLKEPVVAIRTYQFKDIVFGRTSTNQAYYERMKPPFFGLPSAKFEVYHGRLASNGTIVLPFFETHRPAPGHCVKR